MSYQLHQKVQYLNILNDALESIGRYTPESYYHSIAESVGKFLDSITEINLLTRNYTLPLELTNVGRSILKLRVSKELKKAWLKSIDTGIQHSLEDILYDNKILRRIYDRKYRKVKSEFTFSNDVAEFAQSDIDRANNEYTRLSYNYELAMSLGLYDNLTTREAVAAKYTPEERANFLYTLQYVTDLRQRAEASKSKYIANNYLDQRISVLSDDIATKHDDKVKESISKFLSRDVRYLSRLQGNEAIARNRTSEIAKELEKDVLSKSSEKKVDPNVKQLLLNRARNILLTEISLAYNVGKMSAFTSPLDSDTRFRWEVNWELVATKDNYQICPDCMSMNGRIYTARQILESASRIDTGILNYNGSFLSKTDFKNPTLPGIPFHPSCMCRWVVIPKPPAAAMIPASTSVPVSDGSVGSIAPAILGTTLLVGGLFLLARSNAWKVLLQSADEIVEAVPAKVPDVIKIPTTATSTATPTPTPVTTPITVSPKVDADTALKETIDYITTTQEPEIAEVTKEVIREGIVTQNPVKIPN